jgi:hypothetical protein
MRICIRLQQNRLSESSTRTDRVRIHGSTEMANTSMRLAISLFVFTTVVVTPAIADISQARAQLCWTLGPFDNTVYFAEAEGREDRQASFTSLLDISAIDHRPVECRTLDLESYHAWRTVLMKAWSQSEFEIVNTTFMSDLDY